MLQLIADKTQTLKEFTENHYAQGAFFWNYLLKNREIKINGKRVGADLTLHAGDVVCYYLSKKQEEKPAFYKVYEDDNVLVVDKESGVHSEAVFSALLRERECYFIHRLDRNTKGLLIFALNKRAETELLYAFKEHLVEKKYHALCFGKFSKEQDILTAYLKKDAEKAEVRIFDTPQSGGEKIITEYRVLDEGGDITRVEVTLHTGKTHQIRAHLAHVHCPIVGDMKYGDTAKNKAHNLTRQCLVAKYLRIKTDGEFAYLSDLKWVSRFEAELPNAFP